MVALGFWVQLLSCAAEVAPELWMPSAPARPVASVWVPVVLVGRVSLQACVGSWLPLMLMMLSLLKPLGPLKLAALATGADRPTSAAVATASAKARFFPDMLCLPPSKFRIQHAAPA